MRKRFFYFVVIAILFALLQIHSLPKLYAKSYDIQGNEEETAKQYFVHFDKGHEALRLAYENYEQKSTQEVNLYLYEAHFQFTEALVYLPNDISALVNRAHIATSLQKYDEALADYEQVLAIQPDMIATLEMTHLANGRWFYNPCDQLRQIRNLGA